MPPSKEARQAEILRAIAAELLKDDHFTELMPEAFAHASDREARRALMDAADALDPPEREGRKPKPSARKPAARDGGKPPDSIVAYTDGASRGNPGPAGAGALLTDEHGEPLAELREHIGAATNNVAEYRALLLALREAAALGARRVQVRADSELMVRQMTGVYKVRNPDLIALAAEAKRLEAGFDRVRYEHVRREFNQEADRLANEAIDRSTRR